LEIMARRKAIEQSRQARSLAYATRNHQPWEDWEIALIATGDLSIQQLAKRLNRTFYAIKNKRKQHRQPSDQEEI